MTETRRELADDLTMLASQLREKGNDPPHPWTLDDWLERYRTWHKARKPARSVAKK